MEPVFDIVASNFLHSDKIERFIKKNAVPRGGTSVTEGLRT